MKKCLSMGMRFVVLAMFLMATLSSLAKVQVSGLVVDQGHEPIIGASVHVKGYTTGVSTDLDGNFTLKVPSSKSTLVISYVGFKTREVEAGSHELKAGIVLSEDSELLDEVLVIGYGSVIL